MKNIPQADLNEFLSGDPKRKSDFVQFIGASFKEIGFLALRGHFLEEDLQADLYREINAFLHYRQPIKKPMKLREVEVREVIPVLE